MMRIIFSFFILTLGLGFTTNLTGQVHGFCGTEDQHLIIERLQQNRAEFKHKTLPRTNAPSYIPVIYHLVGDDDGSNRLGMRELLAMHCFLNEFFDSLDLQFYISDINNINLTTVNNDPRNPNSQVRMRLQKKSNGINIFIVNRIGGSQSGGGITLGYYTPSDDYIVLQQDQATGFSFTLAHEIGHYFTLAHTFFGWEATTYDPTKPTPTTVQLGNISVNVEYVDRNKNCKNAADNFCDTPPDYLLGFQNPGGGCSPYTGPAKDPDGVPVKPMENNLMSYFERCVFYVLTPEQKNAILMDFNSLRRSFLRRGWTPPSSTVTNNVNYLQPGNGEDIQIYKNITLDWANVPGATMYMVEIDRVNTFNLNPITFITDESFVIVPELIKNRTYYWRVSPYNDYNTCAVASSQTFRTGDRETSVRHIDGLEEMTVRPNPVTNGQAYLFIKNTQPLDALFTLVDIHGRVLWYNNAALTAGEHQLPLNINTPVPGIYFLKMESNRGISTQKLVIQP
jgi:hypothetical protein